MTENFSTLPAILPFEGRHVLHLFYRVEQETWRYLEPEVRNDHKNGLASLIQEIQGLADTQLLPLSIVGPRADLGFMLITPDLQVADRYAKRLGEGLGPGIFTPVFSWLSMTERSEYTTTEEEYAISLIEGDKLERGSFPFREKMNAFRDRMTKYLKDRLEPNLPPSAEWPVFCFYPMSKRRNPEQNWYAEDFETRKELMAGHARIGRSFTGRVRQLITGSTGLDDMEWGVTLFAKTTSEIKSIVYEMRFDEVSSRYAEFGEFFIGIQMDVRALYDRINL